MKVKDSSTDLFRLEGALESNLIQSSMKTQIS